MVLLLLPKPTAAGKKNAGNALETVFSALRGPHLGRLALSLAALCSARLASDYMLEHGSGMGADLLLVLNITAARRSLDLIFLPTRVLG